MPVRNCRRDDYCFRKVGRETAIKTEFGRHSPIIKQSCCKAGLTVASFVDT